MSLEDNNSENLDEVKADHSGGGGDVPGAEVEDPKAIKSEDPKADGKKKKKAEEAGKGVNTPGTKVDMKAEENDEEEFVPVTKAGMINTVLDEMKGKTKAELEAIFGDVLNTINEEDEDDEDDDEDDDDDDKDDKDVDDEMDNDDDDKKKEKKLPFVKKEDLDLSSDTAALFEGEELSDEFKEKATIIFEATTVSKINEKLAEIAEQTEEEMEEAKLQLVEEMAAKVDGYLEYVVEEWVKDNELAIESGITTELTEDFIRGFRTLCEDHYIDIPEDKVDVLEAMGNRIAELESQLDKQINEVVELRADNEDHQKDDILDEIADNLVETDAEKLRSLAEGVEFENNDDYRVKLETLKENYFPKATKKDTTDDLELDEDGLDDGSDKPAGTMGGYVDAISRTSIK